MCVGRSLLAYLSLWIKGHSFLMMLVMVWLCLRSSWTVMPRRGACVSFRRRFVCTTGWVCLVDEKARRKLNWSWFVSRYDKMYCVVGDEM